MVLFICGLAGSRHRHESAALFELRVQKGALRRGSLMEVERAPAPTLEKGLLLSRSRGLQAFP